MLRVTSCYVGIVRLPRILTLLPEALTRTIKKLDAEGKEIVLTGDTNCDYKIPKDCNTRKLKLLYSEFQFEQLITDFTRVATKTSCNGEKNTNQIN